jgi:hypothetical protein
VSRLTNLLTNPPYVAYALPVRLAGRVLGLGRRPKLPLALGFPWP